MPTENDKIVAGVVIAIIILLLALAFIFILVTFANNRKRKFYEEKESLQSLFKAQLLQTQLEIQEQTFKSISNEIHDNVGQVLSLAKVQLNIMEEGSRLDLHLIADLKESLAKAMIDLRDIAKSLSADRVKNASLAEITAYELERIGRIGVMVVDFQSDGQERSLTPQKKLIIFRMIQESLQNILKHADAKNINVIFLHDESFTCIIRDNGKGFDAQNMHSGLGLQNMKGRATFINGAVSIVSAPSVGTTITIKTGYE